MLNLFDTIMTLSFIGSVLALFILLFKPAIKKRCSAAWQYYVWLVIVSLYLIPFKLNIPGLERLLGTFPRNFRHQGNLQQVGLKIKESYPSAIDSSQVYSIQPGMVPTPLTPNTSLEQYLIWIWIIGVFIFVLYHTFCYIKFRLNLTNSSLPITEPLMLETFHCCCNKSGVKKHIAVMFNPNAGYPMITGFFKPLLILPQLDFTPGELNLIYKHELIHYKRKDLWYKLLALFANAIHWFNPIAYLVVKNINEACEYSCDAAMIKSMNKNARRFYGEMILNLISKSKIRETQLITGLNKSRKGIEQRLENIINPKESSKGLIALLIVLSLSLIIVSVTSASAKEEAYGNEVFAPHAEAQINLNEEQPVKTGASSEISTSRQPDGRSNLNEEPDNKTALAAAAKDSTDTNNVKQSASETKSDQEQNKYVSSKALPGGSQVTKANKKTVASAVLNGYAPKEAAKAPAANSNNTSSQIHPTAPEEPDRIKELVLDTRNMQTSDKQIELSFIIKNQHGKEIKDKNLIKSLFWVSSIQSDSLTCDGDNSKLIFKNENGFKNDKPIVITCIDPVTGCYVAETIPVDSQSVR